MSLVPAREDPASQFFWTLNKRYGGVPLPLEILELVLCHVSRKDTLRQMTVCKVWAQASLKALYQEVSCANIVDRLGGLRYLQQCRRHKHHIRHIRWNQGLMPLLRFLEVLPDVEMLDDEQEQNVHPPMVQLNIGDHIRQRQPELDRIDLEILSPTTATRQIKTLFLGHHHYCYGVKVSADYVVLRQQLTALLRLFPRVSRLKIPNIGMHQLDSTMSALQDVVRTAKEQLYEREDFAHLRWHLVELEVSPSIFTLVDERWFFEKSWYLVRLHLTAIVRWDSNSSQMGSFSAKRFAHLLMECCPNVEEVELSSNIYQYLWHLLVDDLPQTLSMQGEDASANEKEWKSWKYWTPLHQKPADTLAVNEFYSNQIGEVLSSLSLPSLQVLCKNASALKMLSVKGYHISPLQMAPSSTLTISLTQEPVGIDSGVVLDHDGHTPGGVYKPWACLGLEQLKVPIRCETVSVHEHQRAFEQLGQLRQLQVLDLAGSSLLLSKKYGIEALRGLTKLHTFGYTKTAFSPSKDGLQWILSTSESQWKSLRRIHIDIGERSTFMQNQLQEWIDEVFAARPGSHTKPTLSTLDAPRMELPSFSG
ncbi:hypothetical protein BGW41_006733 [Actinomortierella wolfii]|nr:hypothetical protein BGW41_006733 [Actinomortierella wolfii]